MDADRRLSGEGPKINCVFGLWDDVCAPAQVNARMVDKHDN